MLRGIGARPNGYKSDRQNRLEAAAQNAILEYRLVKDGVASYVSLGYEVPDQGAMYYKLIEYLVIDETINEAQIDQQKTKTAKR